MAQRIPRGTRKAPLETRRKALGDAEVKWRVCVAAAAEAAARGEASGADVGDALVGDVRDSAASALRFEAGLGRQARETRAGC